MSDPIETQATSADHAHEKSDAKARPIALFELAILALIAVAMALMAGMFYYFTHREAALDAGRSPLARESARRPEPNLQVNPTDDLGRLRAAEEEQLSGYGWVDREQKLVRIPIERAMDILAERGLPASGGNGNPR